MNTDYDSCPICGNNFSVVDQKYNEYYLVKCVLCETVYSTPHKSDINIYEDSYKNQINSYGRYTRDSIKIKSNTKLTWAQFQLRNYLTFRSGKLLDIGCSTGLFMSAFKKLGFEVYGIEPSQVAIDSMPSSIKKNVINGVLEKDKYKNSYFDLVTAWEVIEHLENPGEFLQNVKVLLKKDGILALSCPNWNSPWEKKTKDVNRRPPFHLNYFTETTLPKLLRKYGFEILVVKCKPFPWTEELGNLKWLLLPYSLLQTFLFKTKPNRLLLIAKPHQ